jgi:spore maturation protein CgeB
VFGLDYYAALSVAEIVLNGAIDMAGSDRGNMRWFEALGSGALLLSGEGNYPEGMKDGETIATYDSPQHAVSQARAFLAAEERRSELARAGHEMVSSRSKEVQWQRFEALVVRFSAPRTQIRIRASRDGWDGLVRRLGIAGAMMQASS